MLIRYFLNPEAGDALDVQAEVHGTAKELRLMDVSGFLTHAIRNLTPIPPSEIGFDTVDTGVWRLPLKRGNTRFRYSVPTRFAKAWKHGILPVVKGTGSTFFLGNGVFLRALLSEEVRYEIRIAGHASSSLPATGHYWTARNGRQLSLGGFVCGDFTETGASGGGIPLSLLFDRGMEGLREEITSLSSLLVQEMTRIFGETPSETLSMFIFKAPRSPAPGEKAIGSGLSFHRGIFLQLTASSKANAWLILHELAHQWLGQDIHAGEPGVKWFLEGTASWCAMTAAQALGFLTRDHRHELLSQSGETYLRAAEMIIGKNPALLEARTTHSYETEGGILLIHGLDRFFRNKGRTGFRDFLRAFYTTFRGAPISNGDILRAAETFAGTPLPPYVREFLEKKGLLPFREWVETD